MKKIIILLMTIGLLAACNNNKAKGGLFGGLGGNKNQNNNNRNKDDYGNKGDRNKDENNDYSNNKSGGWSIPTGMHFSGFAKIKPNDVELANGICPCVLEKLEKEFTDLNDMNARGTAEEGTRDYPSNVPRA